MLLISYDGDLAEQWELQRIFGVAKLCNFFVVSRFLFAKVVGRKG